MHTPDTLNMNNNSITHSSLKFKTITISNHILHNVLEEQVYRPHKQTCVLHLNNFSRENKTTSPTNTESDKQARLSLTSKRLTQ